MQLTCTETTLNSDHGTQIDLLRAGRRAIHVCHHFRGTAEIELLLVIVVLLIPVLLLTAAAWTLGKARLASVFNAENGAYMQVVSGIGTTAAPDPPPEGFNAVRPLDLNRYAYGHAFQVVTPYLGSSASSPAQVDDRAILLDPTWHYGAFPVASDQMTMQAWFAAYVEESHTPAIVTSLGLRPPGPP